jgi:hypothetical protein
MGMTWPFPEMHQAAPKILDVISNWEDQGEQEIYPSKGIDEISLGNV